VARWLCVPGVCPHPPLVGEAPPRCGTALCGTTILAAVNLTAVKLAAVKLTAAYLTARG
jgi:hypothetical protein